MADRRHALYLSNIFKLNFHKRKKYFYWPDKSKINYSSYWNQKQRNSMGIIEKLKRNIVHRFFVYRTKTVNSSSCKWHLSIFVLHLFLNTLKAEEYVRVTFPFLFIDYWYSVLVYFKISTCDIVPLITPLAWHTKSDIWTLGGLVTFNIKIGSIDILAVRCFQIYIFKLRVISFIWGVQQIHYYYLYNTFSLRIICIDAVSPYFLR